MLAGSSKTRTWAIVASLLCLPVLLFPPWHGGARGSLFSPPVYGSLDYGRLALELGVVFLVATLLVFSVSLERWNWLQGKWLRTTHRGLLWWIAGGLIVLGGLWAVLRIPQTLPADELALITGQGGSSWNTFDGTVYNGSGAHVLREITIIVNFRPGPRSLPGTEADERTYQVRNMWVPPLTVGTFSVNVISLPGLEFDHWRIISARGIKTYWPPAW
jgi:hypothetical protein